MTQATRHRVLMGAPSAWLILACSAPGMAPRVTATTHSTRGVAAAPCPMAHCTPQMTDYEGSLPAATTSASVTWTFSSTALVQNHGVPGGLGCTSGTAVAFCAATNSSNPPADDQPYLYALAPESGQVLWTSQQCGCSPTGHKHAGGAGHVDGGSPTA